MVVQFAVWIGLHQRWATVGHMVVVVVKVRQQDGKGSHSGLAQGAREGLAS